MPKTHRKVVVIQPVHQAGMDCLGGRGNCEIVRPASLSEADVTRALSEADAILLRTTKITPQMLAHAGKLRIISRHGVGLDNVPLDACREQNITVAHVGDANAIPVAEQTFALLLGVAKQLVPYDHAVRTGDYQIRNSLGMRELFGKVILILGLGRVGRNVARLALAFQMKCLAFDPALPDEAFASARCVRVTDWRLSLSKADVVTLHMPLTDDASGLIGATELALMKPQAILVNCARGGLIDETALNAALQEGRIFGAGLDVTKVEPPSPDLALLRNGRVLLSPHSAALTEECAVRMAVRSAQNILDYFDGCLDPVFIA